MTRPSNELEPFTEHEQDIFKLHRTIRQLEDLIAIQNQTLVVKNETIAYLNKQISSYDSVMNLIETVLTINAELKSRIETLESEVYINSSLDRMVSSTPTKEIYMSLFDEHPVVTAYLKDLVDQSEVEIRNWPEGAIRYQLGTLKAQLHYFAQRFPGVAEYLAGKGPG